MQYYADHVWFYARVKVLRSWRCNPSVELCYTVDRSLRGAPTKHHVDPQAVEVALTILLLSEFRARGHMEQVVDRRLAVRRALKVWHILFRCIIDRVDRALAEGNANQHRCDRLRH